MANLIRFALSQRLLVMIFGIAAVWGRLHCF